MKKKKESEPSVLQGAKVSPVQQMPLPENKTSPIITIPLALAGIAAVIFALVKWVKFAWYW